MNKYFKSISVFYLLICILIVISEPGNLASGKPAEQSETDRSHYASLAVDGNNSTSPADCITTAWMKHPWWRVDLKGLYIVHRLYILNTDDSIGRCKLCANFIFGRMGVECFELASQPNWRLRQVNM